MNRLVTFIPNTRMMMTPHRLLFRWMTFMIISSGYNVSVPRDTNIEEIIR